MCIRDRDKARYSITHHSLEDEDARQFSYDTKRLLHALVASTDDYIYVCNMAEDPSTFLYSQAMVKEFGLPHQVIHDAASVSYTHLDVYKRQWHSCVDIMTSRILFMILFEYVAVHRKLMWKR